MDEFTPCGERKIRYSMGDLECVIVPCWRVDRFSPYMGIPPDCTSCPFNIENMETRGVKQVWPSINMQKPPSV